MAVAFRSSSSYNSGSSTVTSFTVNAPSGLTVNDYIYFVCTTSGTSAISLPVGWTSRTTGSIASNSARITLFWKFATNSEPASYTFNASSACYTAATISAYSGVDLASPHAGIAGLQSTGTSTAVPNTGVQVDKPYELMAISSINTTSAVSISTPSTNMTVRADTTTTSGTFIQTAILDGTPLNPRLDSVFNNASTFTGSTTANNVYTGYLRADNSGSTTPNLDYHLLSFFSASSTLTQTIFGPKAGVVCTLVYIWDTSTTVTSMSSPNMVWTRVATARGAGYGIELWQSYVSTTAPYPTIITLSASSTGYAQAMVFPRGQLGASTATTGSGTSINDALVTTANNSFVVSGLVRDVANTAFPNASATLLVASAGSGTTQLAKDTVLVPTAGSGVTHSYIFGTSGNNAMIIFEIKPYVPPSSSFFLFT